MIDPYYQEKLSRLKVDRSSGHPKPHKVCLLLAIIDLIKEEKLVSNSIVINDDLKAAFHVHFEKLHKGNDAEKIITPFYHLQSDGIWHFKVKDGQEQAFIELSGDDTPGARKLFQVIDYAYLDDALFNYFKNELVRPEAIALLLQNLEDLSVQFQRWLIQMGRSEKTATNYVGAIRGSISKWATSADITNQNLISIQSYSQINKIAEQLAGYDVFKDHNSRGGQMYSAALNAYRDFLASTNQANLVEDIENIVTNRTIDETQRARLVNTRIGQGQFRDSLISYWKGCAVTGYPSVQFLVASHIKPWRYATDSERLDVFNGILLLPNLDKVFDLCYITFEPDGAINISSHIEEPEVLGINKNLRIPLTTRHEVYMEHHRLVFEQRNKSN